MTDAQQAQDEINAAVARAIAGNPKILTAGGSETKPPDVAVAAEANVVWFAPRPDDPSEMVDGIVTRSHKLQMPDERGPETADSAAVPERLRLALRRRRAFRLAMVQLRELAQADVVAITDALNDADPDALAEAFTAHAVSLFLDEQCGRESSLLYPLNHGLESEIVAAAYADPAGILACTSETSTDGTTQYLRRLAVQASTPDDHLFDRTGRPTRAKVPTLSMLTTLVPRS